MAWGYEKCFTIEHDNTLKRRIDCKDCIYYDKSDKSCMKRPLYLPVDGYNSWRNCKFFELDDSVSHYAEKKSQYIQLLTKKQSIQRDQKKERVNKKSTTGKNNNEGVHIKKTKTSVTTNRMCGGYWFLEVESVPKGKKIQTEMVEIMNADGIKKKVIIGRDNIERKIYVNNRTYKKDAIDKVYQILSRNGQGTK